MSAVAPVVGGSRGLISEPEALTDECLLTLATEFEGHLDNAAPQLRGNDRLRERGTARAARIPARNHLTAIVPVAELSTSPRGALPSRLPPDAASTAPGPVARMQGQRSCCSPRPRIGCTRVTALTSCPRPPSFWRSCGQTGYLPSSREPVRACWCWESFRTPPRSRCPVAGGCCGQLSPNKGRIWPRNCARLMTRGGLPPFRGLLTRV